MVTCYACKFKDVEKLKQNLYYCNTCKNFFLVPGEIQELHMKKVFIVIKEENVDYQLTIYLLDLLKIMKALKNTHYKKHYNHLKLFLEKYFAEEKKFVDVKKTKFGITSMKELIEKNGG